MDGGYGGGKDRSVGVSEEEDGFFDMVDVGGGEAEVVFGEVDDAVFAGDVGGGDDGELVPGDGGVKVDRVVCAVDCGVAINPDVIRAQMEGGVAFGLSAILYGAITLKNGKVEQSNFHDYRVLRMNEAPKVEVYIVPST